MKKKSQGNIMDLVTVGILILAASIVMMTYLQCTQLIMTKLEISQISRKYILKMETEGYLTSQAEEDMLEELQKTGLKAISITGTTLDSVSYGDTITLQIKGLLPVNLVKDNAEEIWSEGFGTRHIVVQERRMSTAKN